MSVRLLYDGQSYDLSTNLAIIQRRLGRPTLRGDTLTWGRQWTRTIMGAPMPNDGAAGLKVIRRNGHIIWIAVHRLETS